MRTRPLQPFLESAVSIAVVSGLALATLLAFQTQASERWNAPPGYTPDSSIKVTGKLLTSREHDVRYPLVDRPYVLHRESSRGALMFVGIRHTSDPDSEQIRKLKNLFTEFKPTVALVEGRISSFQGDFAASVVRFGESGATSWLGTAAKIPVYTSEPTAEAEGAYLLRGSDAKRVAMWLTIRGYVSNRRTREVPDVQVELSLLRRQKQYGLGAALPSLKAMDELWQEDFPSHPGWRKIEEREMWPGEEKTYLNRLANLANEVRDDHMMRTVVDLVRKGERVFFTCGSSHVINQEPVLLSMLEGLKPGRFESPKPWLAKKQGN